LEVKGLKILIHASTWFAPILVPIIVWLVIKDYKIRKLSMQALVFHIVMGVLIGFSIVFSFLLIGIPFLIIFGLMALIAPIIGIIRALNDEPFNYPIAKWFIR
jgi:uncharacterized protein